MRREAVAALACLAFAAAVHSQEDRLISGRGSTLTENKCNICHDLAHIRRAQLSRGEWADNVRNMKERGAPLTEEDAAVIVEYLATYYNRDKPAPPPSPDTLAAGGDDPVQKLLNAGACNGCHSVDKRVVGPSFREVAAKYTGDGAAAERLAAKIRSGGQGVWGQLPMPPNPGLSDSDLRTLVIWVLGQK